MKRQAIEEYLDGALDAVGRAEVEKAIAQDAATARAVAQIKSERALRAAVYASYTPSKSEAAAFASQMMAACEDEAAVPVGSIGPWTWARRISGVAAAVVVMAGIFVAGRVTAPARIVEKETTRMIYSVAYENAAGQIELNEGMTAEERSEYLKDLQEHGPSGFAASDFAPPGQM